MGQSGISMRLSRAKEIAVNIWETLKALIRAYREMRGKDRK